MSEGAQIVGEILDELRKLRDGSVEDKSQFFRETFGGWISAGDGRGLTLTQGARRHISTLASSLYSTEAPSIETISKEDWKSHVTRVIGPILAESDVDNRTTAHYEAVFETIVQQLRAVDCSPSQRSYIFGCSLLAHNDNAQFQIGPVSISHRSRWLDGALAQDEVSQTTHRRLKKLWSGARLRNRVHSEDSAAERDLAQAIGEYPFICSVAVHHQFGRFAKERAVLASCLALLGVALMWRSPRKALESLNLNYDGPAYDQTYLSIRYPRLISCGHAWKNLPHGLSLFGDSWRSLIENRQSWWDAIGDVINLLLANKSAIARPRITKCFTNALVWFLEACREQNPAFATAKFVLALDALACGNRAKGIGELIEARLGVDLDTPIRDGAATYAETLHELYNRRRNPLLHGNSDTLLHDWTEELELAEQLTRFCLLSSFEWASEHSELDDPTLLRKIH